MTAACNILRKQDASAERIAAVQALAAAPALSAASLGKLPHMPARSAAEEEEDGDSHADEADDTFADEDNEEDDYMAMEEDEDVDMVEEEDHPEVSPQKGDLAFCLQVVCCFAVTQECGLHALERRSLPRTWKQARLC